MYVSIHVHIRVDATDSRVIRYNPRALGGVYTDVYTSDFRFLGDMLVGIHFHIRGHAADARVIKYNPRAFGLDHYCLDL